LALLGPLWLGFGLGGFGLGGFGLDDKAWLGAFQAPTEQKLTLIFFFHF
jgi:hypothetical protein